MEFELFTGGGPAFHISKDSLDLMHLIVNYYRFLTITITLMVVSLFIVKPESRQFLYWIIFPPGNIIIHPYYEILIVVELYFKGSMMFTLLIDMLGNLTIFIFFGGWISSRIK